MTRPDLEGLIRAALADDAATYPVSANAWQEIVRRTPHRAGQAPTGARRQRRVRLRLAAGLALGAAASLVIAALVPTGHSSSQPSVLRAGGSSSAAGTAAASAPSAPPPPPAAITGAVSVQLPFTPQRLLLGGSDVYAFGMDSGAHPFAAHLSGGRLVAVVPLPQAVCSASLDGSGQVAVVLGKAPTCTSRGKLRLLDATSLTVQPGSAPAAGGDVLLRPDGLIVADAGTVGRLDRGLRTLSAGTRIGSPRALVNLASAPGRTAVFATVFEPGSGTQLVTLAAPSLHVVRRVPVDAPGGALPYATGRDQAWVSLVGMGGGYTSEAQLFTGDGSVAATAFGGSDYATTFAESGRRLWALSPDLTLRCAGLADGVVRAASAVPAFGLLAADNRAVYVAPAAGRVIEILTPSSAC